MSSKQDKMDLLVKNLRNMKEGSRQYKDQEKRIKMFVNKIIKEENEENGK